MAFKHWVNGYIITLFFITFYYLLLVFIVIHCFVFITLVNQNFIKF